MALRSLDGARASSSTRATRRRHAARFDGDRRAARGQRPGARGPGQPAASCWPTTRRRTSSTTLTRADLARLARRSSARMSPARSRRRDASPVRTRALRAVGEATLNQFERVRRHGAGAQRPVRRHGAVGRRAARDRAHHGPRRVPDAVRPVGADSIGDHHLRRAAARLRSSSSTQTPGAQRTARGHDRPRRRAARGVDPRSDGQPRARAVAARPTRPTPADRVVERRRASP